MYTDQISNLVRIAKSIRSTGIERLSDVDCLERYPHHRNKLYWITFRSEIGELTCMVILSAKAYSCDFLALIVEHLCLISLRGLSHCEFEDSERDDWASLMGGTIDEWDWYDILQKTEYKYALPTYSKFADGMTK